MSEETVAIEKRRLVVMQWGLVVAIVAAAAALIVPFATQALAEESAENASTQERITALLTRTAELETSQRHIQDTIDEVKVDVGRIEQDVKDIQSKVSDNNAELRSITTLLNNRLPDPARERS